MITANKRTASLPQEAHLPGAFYVAWLPKRILPDSSRIAISFKNRLLMIDETALPFRPAHHPEPKRLRLRAFAGGGEQAEFDALGQGAPEPVWARGRGGRPAVEQLTAGLRRLSAGRVCKMLRSGG